MRQTIDTMQAHEQATAPRPSHRHYEAGAENMTDPSVWQDRAYVMECKLWQAKYEIGRDIHYRCLITARLEDDGTFSSRWDRKRYGELEYRIATWAVYIAQLVLDKPGYRLRPDLMLSIAAVVMVYAAFEETMA